MTPARIAYEKGACARYGHRSAHANPYDDFECGAAWAVGFALIKREHLTEPKKQHDDALMKQARMLELEIWQ